MVACEWSQVQEQVQVLAQVLSALRHEELYIVLCEVASSEIPGAGSFCSRPNLFTSLPSCCSLCICISPRLADREAEGNEGCSLPYWQVPALLRGIKYEL